MEPFNVFLLSILLFSGTTVAAECEADWIAYKDLLCIKIFPTDIIEFEEAEAFCSSQGTEPSQATLVMVKDSELQDLLANYTSDIYDNVWIGARYDNETAQFRWLDGEPLNYTNWEEGYPRNNTGSDTCVELRPVNAKSSTTSDGKWADAACQRRNLAMCQKALSWTLQDAIDEIIRIRNNLQTTQGELQTAKTELQTTKNDLLTTKSDLQSISTRVVPIGSIYIEYYNQPSPPSLWPSLSWQDISSTYAGLFFRASGGGSAGWGVTQSECAPRITEMQCADGYEDWYPERITLPANGWSPFGVAGWHDTNPDHIDIMQFNTEGCEIRPKNQAVRVWKRTG